jgi:hypothetical protein
MKKIFLMFTLALCVAAISCSKDPIFGDDNKGGCHGRDPKPTSCESVKVDTNAYGGPIDCTMNENIKRAWIEGDNLKVEVAYSGCNQHDFDLTWNGAWLKSLPAQAHVNLMDNTGEQMCDAYFTHTLCFDISQMRNGNSPRTIQIHLMGYMEDLAYKY